MKRILVIAVFIGLALLPSSVLAAINTINAGDVAFIGEEGLNIAPALVPGQNQIAWFPSTATTASATPEKVIDVSATKTSFYVTPTDFSSRLGNWYSWAPGLTAGTASVAFRVDDPYLVIRVQDTTVGLDVTNNQWLYQGDTAQFRIETNMYPMAGRGTPGAPVTIKVQSPDGAIYTSLYDPSGTTQSLEIAVPSSPYNVPAVVWDSGNSQYKSGTYSIWAECTANGINNNHPVTGKTVSSKVSLLLSEFNPLIKGTSPPATTVPQTTKTTNPPVTSVKTTPRPTTTNSGTPVPPTPLQEKPVSTTDTREVIPTPTYANGFGFSLTVLSCIAGITLFSLIRKA